MEQMNGNVSLGWSVFGMDIWVAIRIRIVSQVCDTNLLICLLWLLCDSFEMFIIIDVEMLLLLFFISINNTTNAAADSF